MSSFQAWSTADEIKWLDKIGSAHTSTRNMPVKKLLEGYLQGLKKRYYMPTIVREEVEAHAKQLLQQLNMQNRKPL